MKKQKKTGPSMRTADENTKEVLSGKYLKLIKGFNYHIMRATKR